MTDRGFRVPLLSPLMMLMRIGMGALLCIFMIQYKVNSMMIDLTNYAIPDAYLVYMLVASIVLGFMAAITLRAYDHNKAAENKAAKGTIASTNDLPYDRRYDLCTAVAFICGSAIGMYATPAIIDAIFIGAGLYTFIGVSAVASAFFVVILMRLLHLGVREFIVQAGKYAVETSEAIKDAKEDIDAAAENVAQVIPDLNQKP
jgi:hypothetical protein